MLEAIYDDVRRRLVKAREIAVNDLAVGDTPERRKELIEVQAAIEALDKAWAEENQLPLLPG